LIGRECDHSGAAVKDIACHRTFRYGKRIDAFAVAGIVPPAAIRRGGRGLIPASIPPETRNRTPPVE